MKTITLKDLFSRKELRLIAKLKHAIEVYAGTQEGAELLRDEILERIC